MLSGVSVRWFMVTRLFDLVMIARCLSIMSILIVILIFSMICLLV